MKTVVITGSGRGFGYEMAKEFLKFNYNVVITDINEEVLKEAKKSINSDNVYSHVLNVCDEESIQAAIEDILEKYKTIDIWINNAGVSQPDKYIWELNTDEINTILDIDLKGTIICSNKILPVMIKQKHGQIFNVEGHGSNDALIDKLSIYGTAKRGITYFTETLSHEVKKYNNIYVGKITPGIMITNFLFHSLGDKERLKIDEKTKKIYNILGDYPQTIAKFMVKKIVNNKKNNVKFMWLTNRKAFGRFIKSIFIKRDLFNDKK